MLAVRGIYDGKNVKVLSSETLPVVYHEVSVAIVFLENITTEQHPRAHLHKIAQRMRSARATMSPLGITVKELVEAGRER